MFPPPDQSVFEFSSTLFSISKDKSGEKKKAPLVIALPLSVPIALHFFNLSLRSILQVSSLYLACFSTYFYFINLEKIAYPHSEGHLPEKDREPHLFKRLHSNYLSVNFVHQFCFRIDGLPPHVHHNPENILTEPTDSVTSLG